MIRRFRTACLALLLAGSTAPAALAEAPAAASLRLTPCRVEGVVGEVRCGTFPVPENRRTGRGRMLALKIVLIPARRPDPATGPIFYLAGGPGETATELIDLLATAAERETMDLVFVDQRGTGDGHRLDCPPPGSDRNPAGYLKGPFDLPTVRACRDALARRFDLARYATATWIEDLEAVRRALGYARINIVAGSMGTYVAQRYIRRYGAHVRAAYLLSPVPMTNRTPLHMARDGQAALDRLIARCAAEAACDTAYPDLGQRFAAVLARVRQAPVETWLVDPASGRRRPIRLTEAGFVDAVRVFLYRSATAREIPWLIDQAAKGDFSAFADAAVRTVRNFYGGVRSGVALAVTCNEFVNRIRPEEVAPAAAGSFLGRWRIDAQRGACAIWPATDRPGDDQASFRSKVPVLLVTGDSDPVAPPVWAEAMRDFLPNARHLIVPGAGHTEENDCILGIRAAFFRAGSIAGLDTGCMAGLRPASFRLP